MAVSGQVGSLAGAPADATGRGKCPEHTHPEHLEPSVLLVLWGCRRPCHRLLAWVHPQLTAPAAAGSRAVSSCLQVGAADWSCVPYRLQSCGEQLHLYAPHMALA